MTAPADQAISDVSAQPSQQLLDVDVHPVVVTTLSEVFAYLPRAQRERVAYLGELPLSQVPVAMNFLIGRWAVGRNAPPLDADRPGASPERLAAELGASGVTAGQLIALEAPAHALQSRNYDLAADLMSAFNDFMLERWLVDARLHYALAVTPDDAVAAVAEIHKHGGDPRVSSVWLPPGKKRLGDRHYDPVHAAAAELGLPILSHPGGPRSTMAPPEYALEGAGNRPQGAWSAITSLVAHGALERHPNATFVVAEGGFTWLPSLLRRLDAAWSAQRDRLPELRRRPSDAIRAQVKLTTSPLDDDRGADELAPLLDELADVLVYGSNHPRADATAATFAGAAETTRRRIFVENAQAAMRLDR